MKKVFLLLVTALMASIFIVTDAPSAVAAETICAGHPPAPAPPPPAVFDPVSTLPAGGYGDIVVPPGGSCVLRYLEVSGNVRVSEGASLFAFDNVIHGTIAGYGSGTVRSVRNTIGGHIVVRRGGPGPFGPAVLICQSTLTHGNIAIEGITGGISLRLFPAEGAPGLCGPNRVSGSITILNSNITLGMRVEDNVVGNNLIVLKNTGATPKLITRNTVGTDLVCLQNDPPFTGTGNVARRAFGQCGL